MKANDEEANLLYQLSRKLIFLASGLLIAVIAVLAYQALRPSFGNGDSRKYDEAYFAEAVANYGQYELDPNRVVDGVHVATGMKIGKGFSEARAACTGCHSPKLITQNRATREGWEQMIRWMQATQGLPDLGKNEPIILDYLALNYAPENLGRRKNLNMNAIEWYVLNLDN